MRYFAYLMIVFLVGCTTIVHQGPQPLKIITFKDDQMFDDTEGASAKTIRWVRLPHDELQKRCASLTGMKKTGSEQYLGCASYNIRDFCVVYTGTSTSHQVLGHEVRHCYHGDFHK